MSGFAEDNGIGDSWHGAVLAPGDGTTPIDEDTKVAVGSAFNDQRDVRVTVHSHDDLVVDWRFSPRTTTAYNYREHAVKAGLGEMAIEDGLQTGVTATMERAVVACPLESLPGIDGSPSRWYPTPLEVNVT